ncbi:MAG: prepilin-type N-terminal cleavage/methylation domain-containing protein [Gemmatimonadales bacterium]|jgi:prepilin-type N-terminal cleavage/methylation domain-containing protein
MKRARGFTLIEMLISLVVLSIVMSAAIWFFRGVSKAVSGTADRMDAMQNLRYGISTLDRELRNAGAGTTGSQPTLVYISPTVVVFNADIVANYAGSPTAVNYDPDVSANAVSAPTTSQKFLIPGTSILYPDSTYRTTGGDLSPAETLTYWVTPDSTPGATGLYLLMRQVNNNAPDVVARNLMPFPGQPFFSWLQTDTSGNLFTVATANLPMRHSVPIHGALGDTGVASRIDSIRAVQVSFYASNGLTGTQQVIRALATTIRIPNAGLATQRSCGDQPLFGKTVAATFTGTDTVPVISVSWSPATDETGGQQDVEKYLVYRRTAAGTFAGALNEVAAGQSSYTFKDGAVLNDSTYYYQVTAVDCTPLESTPSASGAVTVPH